MYFAKLSYFDPNPWQPRQRMAEGALGELAENIRGLKDVRPETRGLLQLPSARLVDLNGRQILGWGDILEMSDPRKDKDLTEWLEGCEYRLQLGIGHRRHAAFVSLAVNGDADYERMPFELADYTDEGMFMIALSENVARADLSAIEVAQAMARYRDEFGKSSKEIGELFGMSDSAVRNLIRLLELPDEARKAVDEGRMSQGAGRALLSYYALPEIFRTRHLSTFYYNGNYCKAESIVALAMEGGMAAQIEEQVTALIKANSTEMSKALWKQGDVFEEETGIEHPDCKTCPARITRQNKHYCAVRSCYATKERIWERNYLEKAGLMAHLPIYDGASGTTTNFEYLNQSVLVAAQAISCPNLCIRFDRDNYAYSRQDHQHCTVPEFPGAEIVCKKLNQHCTCLKAKNAGINIAPNYAPMPEINDDNPGEERVMEAAVPVTADDLKQINRVINVRKKAAREEAQAIREVVAQRYYEALSMNHLGAWKKLVSNLYDFRSEGRDALSLEALFLRVAGHLVERQFQYDGGADHDPDLTLRRLNRWLGEMGLEEVNRAVSVSVETGEEDDLELEECVHDWFPHGPDGQIRCSYCGATGEEGVGMVEEGV